MKQKLNARSQSISQNRFKDPSKVHDYIQINIRMPNPSQEPPASSKASNQDLKDRDVLCTFKIKIESQNLEYVCKNFWISPSHGYLSFMLFVILDLALVFFLPMTFGFGFDFCSVELRKYVDSVLRVGSGSGGFQVWVGSGWFG